MSAVKVSVEEKCKDVAQRVDHLAESHSMSDKSRHHEVLPQSAFNLFYISTFAFLVRTTPCVDLKPLVDTCVADLMTKSLARTLHNRHVGQLMVDVVRGKLFSVSGDRIDGAGRERIGLPQP